MTRSDASALETADPFRDCRRPEQREIAEDLMDKFPNIEILVNNLGIFEPKLRATNRVIQS